MKDCKTDAKVLNRARVLDVTPDAKGDQGRLDRKSLSRRLRVTASQTPPQPPSRPQALHLQGALGKIGDRAAISFILQSISIILLPQPSAIMADNRVRRAIERP